MGIKRIMRRNIAILVLLVVVVVAVSWWVVTEREADSAEHVVIVLLDTVRQDTFGCYGNPLKPTDAMDAVAAEGVRFTQAISSSGWTLPAVASLLTGEWPTIHGATGRGMKLRPIRGELPTAAEVLKREGFKTFGFANAAFVSPMLGLDRGFDVFEHKFVYNWDTPRASETIDAAIRLLRDNHSSPTFFLIHLFDPHLDYDPPPGFAAKFTGGRREPPPPLTSGDCLGMRTNDRRDPPLAEDIQYISGVYQGEINFVDTQVGRLVEALRELGIYDKTTLVITADHGEEFWDHGGFEHGHSLYDELIRIPLIVKFPSRVRPAARVIDTQVRILDVMPTVFDLLGVETPASFAGQSLFPLVMGTMEKVRDLPAFSESLLYGEQKLSWRTSQYKYIHHPRAPKESELYDWVNDPGETNELSAERPRVAARLRGQLLGFYNELLARSETMSRPTVVDLSPGQIDKLRSLGYIR